MTNHRSIPRALVIMPFLAVAACNTTKSAPEVAQQGTAAGDVAAIATPTNAEIAKAAASLTASVPIKPGDRVLINGGVRDARMLEDIAVEVMKRGGRPLVTLASERLARLSYTDVPASYDTLPQTFGDALAQIEDVVITVDNGGSDSVLAGVAPERISARIKRGQTANETFIKRKVRFTNLGNGLYPTTDLAKKLGVTQPQLSEIFWGAVVVPADTIRARGEALRAAFASGKPVTLTSANGTNLTFRVLPAQVAISDGVVTPEEATKGTQNAGTYLPAGELMTAVAPLSAEGKLVIDKLIVQGTDVTGLALTFTKGKISAMTATTGLDAAKKLYDVATGTKDQLGWFDIGLNPAVKLPTATGHIIWMASGNVTAGIGDNQGFGGTAVSDLAGMLGAVSQPTITIDGKVFIDKGVLK